MNKTVKSKKILMLIISIVVCLYAGYFICHNFFKTRSNTGLVSNVNTELQDASTFAFHHVRLGSNASKGSLVALKESGGAVVIYEWQEYFPGSRPYVIVGNKVYLRDCDFDNKQFFLGAIDLNKGNGNYELEKIKEAKSCEFDDFTAVDDDIYYTKSGFVEEVFVLNTVTKEERILVKAQERPNKRVSTRNILASAKEKLLVYIKQVDDAELGVNGYVKSENALYLYNLETNQEELICDECYPEFTHKGKLVYSTSSEGNGTYYEYDFTSKQFKKIVTINNNGWSVWENLIIPSEDGYFFISYDNNITEIFKIKPGSNKELIHQFTDFYPNNILIPAKNTLMFSQFYEQMDEAPLVETRELDLNNQKVVTNENNYYCHIQLVDFKN